MSRNLIVWFFVFILGFCIFTSDVVLAFGIYIKSSWENGSFPSLADLDGDGIQEIISPFSEGANHGLSVWYSNSTLFESWPAVTYITVNPYPAIEDVNKDGENEVVFSDQSGIVHVYYSDGTEMWSNDSCSQIFGYIDSSPVLVDLDNDDNLDILVSCHDFYSMSSALYGFDSIGNYVGLWSPLYAYGDSYGSPVIYDVDGDGYMEILVAGGGYWMPIFVQMLRLDGTEMWLNPDVGLTTEQNLPLTISPAIGDVDDDGMAEVIIASYNDTISMIYLLNSNDGSLENYWEVPQTTPPSPTVLADIDNDGAQEIIIYWNDTVYVWNGSGSVLWSKNVGGIENSMQPPSAPSVADINNDGFLEVLVPSPSSLLIFSNTGSLLANKSFDWIDPNSVVYYPIKSPVAGNLDDDIFEEIVLGISYFGSNSIYILERDVNAPSLIVYSPQNTTYYSLIDIPLNYSVYDDLSGVDSVWYSIDGESNETLYGNIKFNVSFYGDHNLTIYANDTEGNENSSVVFFSVQECPDYDGDGYNSSFCGGNDCDDSNPSINPGASEICGNGIDEDCSGSDLACQQASPPSGPASGGGGYYCVSNWSCSEWSECQSDGTQTRNCTDLKKCIVPMNKPPEKQNCTYTPTVQVRLPVCGDGNCESGEDCSSCPQDCGTCPVSAPLSNETANATGNKTGEVTGLIIGLPQALDVVLFLLIFALGVIIIISFVIKK